MTRIAAVLVTHDSERWIEATAASVVAQSRLPDQVIVVDDASTDATVEILSRVIGSDRLRVIPSTDRSTDPASRIARNFRQGLQECRDFDVAVLGDHDDVWHGHRVEHQVQLLERHPRSTIVASDGRLVDEAGSPIGGTLRDAFPVPDRFEHLAPAERMRTVLRHSIATGGASAVRPSAFAGSPIPPGWLHDRWWSLVAVARDELILDRDLVIDYRLSSGQQVGLDRGRQQGSATQRLAHATATLPRTLGRLRDVHGIASVAEPTTRHELSYPRLLRALR